MSGETAAHMIARDDFLKHVETWCGLEVSLPLELRRMQAGLPQRSAVIQSWAWSGPTIAFARLTEIETDAGFLVYNWACIPSFQQDAPICQAELIEVKGKLFLLVLDVVDPVDSSMSRAPALRWKERLERLHRPGLPQVPERPSWSRGFLTASALWCRTSTSEALCEARAAMRAYLELCSHILGASRADPVRAPRRAAFYRSMRETFLTHEPSRPYMHKTFGKAWSETYMGTFLFPPVAEESSLLECPESVQA